MSNSLPGSQAGYSGRRAQDFLMILGDLEFDLKAIVCAFLVSSLLHLFLFWGLPWQLTPALSAIPDYQREVDYVIVDPPPDPEEMQFVETNPDVPTNEPDETRNIAARDQQAGQVEESAEGPENTPFIDGEEEDSRKVVDGDMIQDPIPPAPLPQPETNPRNEQVADQTMPPTPAPVPDFLHRDKVADEEGLASVHEDPDSGEESVDFPNVAVQVLPSLDSTLDEQEIVEELREEEAIPVEPLTEPQQPRPRPRLSTRVLAGPVMRSVGRAPIIGDIAVDARFDEFGDYLQRMFDAIGFQFQLLASKLIPPQSEISTRVIVEYQITREGQISDMKVIYTSAGRAATLICEDTIQSPAPFGAWTEEMVATLGEEQTIRITFIYR